MKNWIFVLLFAFSIFQTACSGCSKESYDYSPHCDPGTYRCEIDSSMYCNNNYEWQLDETCSDGCDKSTGKCIQLPDEEPETDNENINEDTESCEIDDSFEKSEYDNYFLVKSLKTGTLSPCHEYSPDQDYNYMMLHTKDHPDFSFSSSDPGLFFTNTIPGSWACDYTNLYENMHENVDEKAIYFILHSKRNIPDYSSNYSDPYLVTSYSVDAMAAITESDIRKVGNGEIADFAPVVYILERTAALHNGEGRLKLVKTCLIGKNTTVDSVPEGKFQYCMDENAAIEVEQEIKVGINASIVIAPEEIAEAYAQQGFDACYCQEYDYDNSSGAKTVECPDNFCDVIECPEGTVCTTTDKTDKIPSGYTCILECDDETEVYDESHRVCVCKEGFEKDEGTLKCVAKKDPCKDVNCGENKVCKENSTVDAGYECVCDKEKGYVADPSGEGCNLL